MIKYKNSSPLKQYRLEMVQHYFDRVYKRGAHRIRRRTKEQPKYDSGDTDGFIPISETIDKAMNEFNNSNINIFDDK